MGLWDELLTSLRRIATHVSSPQVVEKEAAVVCIQAHVRGWQARQMTQNAADREDIFLGFAAQVTHCVS